MQKLIYAILVITLSISGNAYAFFCSTQKGHGYINVGDSEQQVQATCGTPDSSSLKTTGGPKMVDVQHWTYTHQPIENRYHQDSPRSKVEYPPDVTFQIVDNKVTAIGVKGKSVSNSNLCRTGMRVQVGQAAKSVLESCGRPDFADSRQQMINNPQQKVAVWTYNMPSGLPVVLEFTNGRLSKIGN